MRLDDIGTEGHLRITTLLFRGGHDDGHPLSVESWSTRTSDHLDHVTAGDVFVALRPTTPSIGAFDDDEMRWQIHTVCQGRGGT